MRIEINQLDKKNNEEESAIFNIFEVSGAVEKAIDILESSVHLLVVQDINSDEFHNIKTHTILYAEYVERKIFLYTSTEVYTIGSESLVQFIKHLPNNFIRVSKNTIINIYQVQSFIAQSNGNLIITMKCNEKLMVSRRYVKSLKEALIISAS